MSTVMGSTSLSARWGSSPSSIARGLLLLSLLLLTRRRRRSRDAPAQLALRLPSPPEALIMAAEGEEQPQETPQEEVAEEKTEEASEEESPEEEKEAPAEEEEPPAEEEEEAPAEEEEEEEEVVDPKAEIEDACKPKCVKQLLAYQACERRIEEDDEGGQKHCTGQYFDYWGCIDKCTAPKLFRKLK